MKVVFLEEVEGTARTGDVKNVAAGFARNYLLPRRLAAPATEHYIAIAQAKAGKEARRQERVDDEARQHLLAKVEGKSISIQVRVGEQDKLFGSVTARDIAEALQEKTRIELDHKQIDLKQPIRDLGAHEVTVKLTRNVHARVTVNVEPLEAPAEAEATAEAEAETTAEAEVETTAPAAEETTAEAAVETAAEEPPEDASEVSEAEAAGQAVEAEAEDAAEDQEKSSIEGS
jgi:large subunit ribosomal protein L9